MTKEELTIWFNNEFWEQYRTLVKTPFATKWKAGTKGEALKKILSLDPSETLRERIMMAIVAQINHRQKLYQQCGSMQAYLAKTNFDKFYSNRMASTWIFNMGWEDEIPQIEIAMQEPIGDSVFCANKNCGFPVHGPEFKYCTLCLGRTNDGELKAQLHKMDMGLREGEKPKDYVARCRQKFKQLIGKVGG